MRQLLTRWANWFSTVHVPTGLDPAQFVELGIPGHGVFRKVARNTFRQVLPEGVSQAVEDLRTIHIPRSAMLTSAIRLEGWIDTEEVAILADWFAATARTFVPSHLGLFTTTPADAGTGGIEVTGGSYARQAFARVGTNWGTTVAGAPSTIQNLLVITFPTATANWGTVTAVGYFDALTVGNLGWWAALGTAKAINSGDTASIAAGALVAQLGDPGDTF